MKHWTIDIYETPEEVSAYVVNQDTQKFLRVERQRHRFNSRDEMVGDLFSGDLPNIRDSFDSDAWVDSPLPPTGRPPACPCGFYPSPDCPIHWPD